MPPLLKSYPKLQKELPYLKLARRSTPINQLKNLQRVTGNPYLYIKRDDSGGTVYGGNKVRKLEFLLGDALRQKSKSVITFGAAGSNHALATSIYAAQAGFKSTSILFPQRNSELIHILDFKSHHAKTSRIIKQITRLDKKEPYVIPPGGSSSLGVVGFVNAAFELRSQIEKGILPEPDVIYLPSGTMGTCAGLLLGLAAAGLKSRVMAVKVTPKQFSNEIRFQKLFSEANVLLNTYDPSFPIFSFPHTKARLRQGFLGRGYGIPSRAGTEAVRIMKEHEGVNLEGTYTGKTMAALLDDIKNGYLKKKYVLFWNTYNSRNVYKNSENIDYRKLPRSFHIYFK